MQRRGHRLFRQQTRRLPRITSLHRHVQTDTGAVEFNGLFQFGRGLSAEFSKLTALPHQRHAGVESREEGCQTGKSALDQPNPPRAVDAQMTQR